MRDIKNISSVVNNFIEIDIKKADKYLGEVATENKTSKAILEAKMDVYASTLYNPDQKLYIAKRKQLEHLRKEKKEVLSYGDLRIINNRLLEISDTLCKSYLYEVAYEVGYTYEELISLIKDFNKNSNYKTSTKIKHKLETIRSFTVPIYVTPIEFMINLDGYKKVINEDYFIYLGPLLTSSIEDGVKYLLNNAIEKNTYYTYINKFIDKFPYLIDKYLDLKEVYEKYEIIVPAKPITKKEITNDFLASGLCVEEYCDLYGVRYGEINKILKVSKLNILDSDSVRESINRTELKFKEITYKIIAGEMDLVSYFMQTKMPVNNYTEYVRRFDFANIPENRAVINKFYINSTKILRYASINRNTELNSKTVINNIEVTREDKELIFNFMDKYELPSSLYLTILRKYIKDSSYVEFIKDKVLEIEN